MEALKPEKVIRDGMVAVLVSPGFGAGWSTWASGDQRQMCMFDRRFVEAAEAKESDVSEIIKDIFGDEDAVYGGGWRDVIVEWVPVGTAFTIIEYDGSESLRTIDELAYVA